MTVHLAPDTRPADAAPAVLRFWFDEVGQERWFVKDPVLDAEIRKRFGALSDHLATSDLNGWSDTPETLLAAVILIDQFSRNNHRGSPRAFRGDAAARRLTMAALERGWDRSMTDDQRQFLLMPLMHSEDIADQRRSVDEFRRLGRDEQIDFAHRHLDQIERFGRFPGRNEALGRRSTEAEQRALDDGAAF